MQLSLYQVALSLLLRVHVTVPGRREAMCGDVKPNYLAQTGVAITSPVATVDNLADFFTKPLRASVFFPMRDRIMNVPSGPRPRGGVKQSGG